MTNLENKNIENKETETEEFDVSKSFATAVPMEKLEKDLQKSKAICYVAGTGCGKSYWVKNVLAQNHSVLFLTSRIAKVNEDTKPPKNPGEIPFKEDFNDSHCLVTTIRLAAHLKKLLYMKSKSDIELTMDIFLKKYDYIVIDEIHALACDSVFQKDILTIQKFIEYAAFVKERPVIALTATIEPIKKYLETFELNGKRWLIEPCPTTNFIIPKYTYLYEKEKTKEAIAKLIKNNYKFVYFCNFQSGVKDIYNYCLSLGVPKEKIAVAMSDDSQDKFEELFKTDDEDNDIAKINDDAEKMLKNESLLPDNTQILISTSKLREGVNIKNKDFSAIVCESRYFTDIIQYMGRVRKEVTSLYIIVNTRSHNVECNENEYKYYANTYVTDACTKHFENLPTWAEKDRFIKFILGTSEYIAYDFITQSFYAKSIRYEYEQQLIESYPKWFKDVEEFIKKFPDHYFLDKFIIEYIEKKKQGIAYINSILGKEIYDKDEKDKVYDSFHDAFDVTKRQPKKLQEYLLFESDKNWIAEINLRGKGKNRDKTGFIIKEFDPNDVDWLKEFE